MLVGVLVRGGGTGLGNQILISLTEGDSLNIEGDTDTNTTYVGVEV